MSPDRSLPSVLAGASLQAIARIVALGLALASTPILARHLGASGFGILSVVLIGSSFVVMVADLGFGGYGAREWATRAPHDRGWLESFWGTRLLTAALTSATCVVLALTVVKEEWRLAAVALSLALPLLLLQSACIGLLGGELRFGPAALPELVARSVFVGLVVMVLVRTSQGWLPAFLAFLAAQTVGALVAIVLLKRSETGRWLRLRSHFDGTILMQAWPLASLPLLGLAYNRVDTVILSVSSSAADVGIYALLYRVLETLVALQALLGTALVPLLARAKTERAVDVIRGRVTEIMLLVFVPVALIVAVNSSLVIGLIGGNSFASYGRRASVALGLLMATFVLMLIGSVNGQLLIAKRKERLLLWHFAATILVNVPLSFILIQQSSFVGAAAAAFVTEIFAVVLSSALVRSALGVSRSVAIRPTVILPPLLVLLVVGSLTRPWQPWGGMSAILLYSVTVIGVDRQAAARIGMLMLPKATLRQRWVERLVCRSIGVSPAPDVLPALVRVLGERAHEAGGVLVAAPRALPWQAVVAALQSPLADIGGWEGTRKEATSAIVEVTKWDVDEILVLFSRLGVQTKLFVIHPAADEVTTSESIRTTATWAIADGRAVTEVQQVTRP